MSYYALAPLNHESLSIKLSWFREFCDSSFLKGAYSKNFSDLIFFIETKKDSIFIE